MVQWEHPALVPPRAALGGGGDPVGGGGEPFVASARFQGARAGYVFKLGPRGLGYYMDSGGGGMGGGSRAHIVAAAAAFTVGQHNAGPSGRGEDGGRGGYRGGRGRGGMSDELDPMDPAAYSDAPRGGWSRGLEVCWCVFERYCSMWFNNQHT